MSLILMTWLATCGALAADGPDPAALVAKLGSADSAERASATASLRALGRSALPALQAAARDGTDGGLRDRASDLWDSIGRDLMTQPSLVRLSARGLTKAAMLEDLRAQTGLSLESNQGSRELLAVDANPTPIPFWTAIDRLGLRRIYQTNPGEGKYPKLNLTDGPGSKSTSVNGPFRLALTGLHLHRDRRTIAGPWVRIDSFGQRIVVPASEAEGETVTFFGDLDLMVEPRMYFTQEGPVRLIEAVDNLGHSLVPDPATISQPRPGQAHFATRSGSGVTQATTEFRLKLQEGLGQTARLRGVVPMMLHLRRPEPALIIPLAGAAGQTFRSGEVEISVESVDDSPMGTDVKTIVKLDVARAELPEHAEGPVITARLQAIGQHQLQLTDPAGKVLAWFAGSGGGGGTTPEIYRWNIGTFRNGRATHLRYYEMLRARADAAFDFQDVPLP